MAAVYRRPTEAHENAEARRDTSSLHERLVAYVHTLEHGSRRGVWGEHSYARVRLPGGRGSLAPDGRARALLAPQALLSPGSLLDVTSPPSPPPAPPDLAAPRAPQLEEDDADDVEWEARLLSSAPGAHHARLAAGVLRALRHLRLQRLVGGGGAWRAREEARAAAGSVRRALAPAWLCGGAVPWLTSSLVAHMPRSARRLYEEVVGELRRAVPRLAERLTGEWAPPPPPDPPLLRTAPVPAAADPWLVWVSSGCPALDARWERRLAALVHTRVLRAPRADAAPPEPWCAAAAAALRSQLTDALAEAGDRSIILGGVGAGAALCMLLARGAGGAGAAAGGVRGAVLCAPPLRSAEGRDEGLCAARLPLLLVVGTRAHNADRAAAHALCERREGAGARRVLEVHGADSQLRIPRRMRARLNLPQHALDAALVEECVRWAIETAEGEETPPSPPIIDMTTAVANAIAPAVTPAPAVHTPAPARRHPLPSIVHHIDLDPDDEYGHLPTAVTPAPDTPQSPRSIEIVEGRVVSRTAGGTPMPLMPPRARRTMTPKANAPTPPTTPSLADIMQMPIVFADDNATDSSSTGSPVTVTSGKARGGSATPPVKMTRVILAKRAGGGAGGGGARALPPDVVTVRPTRPGAVSVRPARSSTVSVRPARPSGVSVRPARPSGVSVRPMSVRPALTPRRLLMRRPAQAPTSVRHTPEH